MQRTEFGSYADTRSFYGIVPTLPTDVLQDISARFNAKILCEEEWELLKYIDAEIARRDG